MLKVLSGVFFSTLVLLQGCGGTGTERVIKSGFGNVGFPDVRLYSQSFIEVASAESNTYLDTFNAYSEFTRNHIGEAPQTGTITMDVEYKVTGWESISSEGVSGNYETFSGLQFNRGGNLTMDFDFDAGTFSGSGDNLTLSGTIEGSDLSGTSNYGGVKGTLDGAVDATETVGAFHGKNSNSTHAGIFVGVAQ